MLKNEKYSFQIAVECENDFIGEFNFNTQLINNISLFSVEHIKSDFPMSKNADDYYRFSKDGFYPDLLVPISSNIEFKKGINVFWTEIVGDGSIIGEHCIDIQIRSDNETLCETSLKCEIINANLDFNDFIYTNWFHTDCLMSYYNVDVFGDDYWRITENFLKTACDYGMNCVLTPIFTPPLDTEIGKERPTVQLVDVNITNGKYTFSFDKLSQWIEMAKKCGIQYFEISHFFTQWGARHAPKIMATVDGEYKKIFDWETKASSKEYTNFLKIFSDEFKNLSKSKSFPALRFIKKSINLLSFNFISILFHNNYNRILSQEFLKSKHLKS